VYDYTCLGVFEVHKLMFSFHMTINIMDGDGQINHKELDFFLKGNTSLDDVEESAPASWISHAGWKDLTKLPECCEIFKNFVNDFKENLPLFKEWYDLEKPENEELPLYNKISTFQLLLVVRCLRPDRIINGVKRFIVETYNNPHFVQPPTLNYEKIFSQSNEKCPIVFILSPGSDP
jgi:dynein heavy chain, axonemal